MTEYFHLSGAWLEPGSVILPGNWGRIIRAAGWAHGSAIREMALEAARLSHSTHLPSRLNSAFAFVAREEAEAFRRANNAFAHHILYRVSMCDPQAATHVTDAALGVPRGDLRHDWASEYWNGLQAQPNSNTSVVREVLTLSPLRIEERLA